MASSNVTDLTNYFNTSPTKCNINVSGCDWVIVQVESLSAPASFNATLDGGLVPNNNSSANATGFQPVQGFNLATGTGSTAAASGSAMYRFQTIGLFLQLSAIAGTTVGRLLVYFSRIS